VNLIHRIDQVQNLSDLRIPGRTEENDCSACKVPPVLWVGETVGENDGDPVGCEDGIVVGQGVGDLVGILVGREVGAGEGACVSGGARGELEGCTVGRPARCTWLKYGL
jgi:hypothetical protein